MRTTRQAVRSTSETAIAVTGLGLVTPLGSGAAAFHDALRTGRSAPAPDTDTGRWVPTGEGNAEGRVLFTARVGDFGAREAIAQHKLRRVPRLGQFCIVAARQALGLCPGEPGPGAVLSRYGGERVGVVLGTGLGAFDQVMEFTAGYLRQGPEGASPASFPTTVMNTAAAMLSMELSILGPNITVNHRDLSAAEAVATGCEQLLLGRADAVLCGGCDELGPWTAHVYARVGALGPGPMRPYDRRRDGMALGEGAVVLLLERLDDARDRGAAILAQVRGVGRAGDDRPRLGWRRGGQPLQVQGAAAAIAQALAQAEIAGAPDFIAGGGNGTDLDLLEAAALRRALGAAAEGVAIASVLGQTGESMMSPGLRLAAGLYALAEQALPGTSLCEDPDPECALPGLCRVPRPAAVRSVLVPVLAQGGANLALCLCAA